jgi:hypothetical protein
MEMLTRYHMRMVLSQARVLTVFSDDKLHPIHYLLSLHLFLDDGPLQMQFCEWVWHEQTADKLFLHSILCRDELHMRVCSTSTAVTSVH